MAHPGGRPPKYDKEVHPKEFIEKSKQGKSITQIARDWDVVRETLYYWGEKHSEFYHALKIGRQHLEAWYTDVGTTAIFENAKTANFNLGAFIWMTKNVVKWSDKVEQKTEVSGGEKAVQIQTVVIPDNGYGAKE